ncbi:glutathione S-transferase T3-like [Vicia villosa]|uniref:glutathione S-transferase T3-like n=1 Tax=Vicia villosa TaxID=3911 RepID=UPI00273CC084|nr:glutathione S-transferase T3-like [Vicia villosa]
MDPNNNPFNTQNSTNYPFNYPNSNNYIFQNQSSNKQGPQNIPNYGFPPNFIISSSNPSYRPYYGMMPYSSQTPPDYSSTPMRNENISNVGVDEFPEFSTQMDIGAMRGGQGATPNADDSTPIRRKSPKWTTDQNLVLISGWIKYGTDSVVGRNQKSDSYWGKIADYCNEHCSFDPPRDGAACRNHYNYMSKILNKWIGAYDNAKRMQQSGWSENDVLAKAHELYSSGKSGHFLLMSEWLAVRDQPRYGSQVGGNAGSGSSGSKRVHESDASDSNSVGSSARPMGRDAAKKKGKKKSKGATLESVNEEWNEFKQFKESELERLDKIAMRQEEANQLLKENTEAKKMKMFMKLSSKEHLDDRSKELLEKLGRDLFKN